MKYVLFLCLFLCGCSRIEFEFSDKTTPLIKENIQPEYRIRTRIIVKKSDVGVTTENADQILHEFHYAENIYSKYNIKFIIVKCDFIREMSTKQCHKDANNYPNMMSVYFVDNVHSMQGESSFPFTNSEKFGIVMMRARMSESALSHEIGHYFGLIHTFDTTDYCNDTPSEFMNYNCKGQSKNCKNVMNYCFHEPKFMTNDQLFRFLSFLVNMRKDHLTTENSIDIHKNFIGLYEPPFKEYFVESPESIHAP